MYVPAGKPFTATLLAPGGLEHLALGARIEVPVTRAIVGYWRPARMDGYVWSVELDAPPHAPERPPELGDDPALRDALAAGAFQIVWMDDGSVPAVEIYVPLFTYTGDGSGVDGAPGDWPRPDLDACTPGMDDVAELLRTRTYNDGVGEFTTFTDETRPTPAEVESLINKVVPVVLSQFRPTFPEALWEGVAHAAALYTAIIIEGSYFREQLNESQVALYRDLYDQAIAGINSQIDAELELVGAGALRLA